ncbi:hypothetical protein Tcan_08539 [Toxocara canis]|uniref:Uncharacterized protein n=1 Tax=Toxocara canis TaxID=6265 RepID=A0A0B2VCS4_TOXCA|nr:hypothetical protein Tcan_08539 [Toxocara canis]
MALPTAKESSHTPSLVRAPSKRLLRYVIRLAPCIFIMITQVLSMTFFIATIILLTAEYSMYRRQIDYLVRNHQKMKETKGQFAEISQFWRCSYDAPVNVSAYNYRMCEYATTHTEKPVAFSIENSWTNGCPKRLNAVPCQSYQDKALVGKDKLASYQHPSPSGCARLYGAMMPYTLSTITNTTLVSRIPADKLAYLKDATILASDLYIKCPRCRVILTTL